MRISRLRLGIILVVAIVIAPIAWYLISPLFITRTVDEDFPAVAAAAPAQDMAPSPVATEVMQAHASPTPIPSATMVVVPPTEVAQMMDASSTQAPSPTIVPEPTPTQAPSPTSEPTAPPVPTATLIPEPVVVVAGAFHPVTHEGTGDATIYRLDDGRLILRFEQFDVLNGPDLYVWLSGAPDANSAQEIIDGGYFEVARLKGNKGNQNYELPADIDISQYRSVTIWCRRFGVNFATAPLR